MKILTFEKLQGLGNDFMLLDWRDASQAVTLDAELISRWAERRFGIGFDQLIVLSEKHGEVQYHFYNADGGAAEQCGNGQRAIAHYLFHQNELNEPLTIHGEGEQTRSFCFVTDLVEGIFRMYRSKESGPVNLGNPVEMSIKQFADTIEEVVGKELKREHHPARADDPRKRCPDISRAKELLGWDPKVNLKEGLTQTVEFFSK